MTANTSNNTEWKTLSNVFIHSYSYLLHGGLAEIMSPKTIRES
ncbi:hypothetical protein VCR3J2_30026 [Vibrio coralliirubri]|nr:hypothetical protein VCR3J2_30026 [Vibrio coralliirubri]